RAIQSPHSKLMNIGSSNRPAPAGAGAPVKNPAAQGGGSAASWVLKRASRSAQHTAKISTIAQPMLCQADIVHRSSTTAGATRNQHARTADSNPDPGRSHRQAPSRRRLPFTAAVYTKSMGKSFARRFLREAVGQDGLAGDHALAERDQRHIGRRAIDIAARAEA